MAGSRAAQTRQKQRAARDKGVGVALIVDGIRFSVYGDDLSAMDTRALRREFGLSFMGVLRALRTDPDLDLFAAIVWLSRRVNGEHDLEFDEVGATFTYKTDFDIVDPDDAEETAKDATAGDGLPEA